MTNIGLVRKVNEDSYLVDEVRNLFVVADGMGGHKGGELASTIAIKTIDDFCIIDKNLENFNELLRKTIEKANSLIYNKAHTDEGFVGMGTTITAIIMHKDRLHIANIGDSRAYLITKDKICLLTQDHSLVRELMNTGEITEEEANNHPNKNILTRALGIEQDVKVDLFEREIKPGECILLCTDGLTNQVKDEEIFNIITNNKLEEAVNNLMDLALKRGGKDNITLVLVNYNE
ncbi:protein phosphatase [Desulfonispora thiosulfatigenes DSM 11270]|uniref:Protein phosphatase n=1 Tax=Desulfonispora thiosulfatigenes DSM 11270 TaxID=656914 RepID=A0A1W1VKF2_DESTI|nr:protein phosphatase [Desulfonispora thiosulfatigenes DSM 11270]